VSAWVIDPKVCSTRGPRFVSDALTAGVVFRFVPSPLWHSAAKSGARSSAKHRLDVLSESGGPCPGLGRGLVGIVHRQETKPLNPAWRRVDDRPELLDRLVEVVGVLLKRAMRKGPCVAGPLLLNPHRTLRYAAQ